MDREQPNKYLSTHPFLSLNPLTSIFLSGQRKSTTKLKRQTFWVYLGKYLMVASVFRKRSEFAHSSTRSRQPENRRCLHFWPTTKFRGWKYFALPYTWLPLCAHFTISVRTPTQFLRMYTSEYLHLARCSTCSPTSPFNWLYIGPVCQSQSPSKTRFNFFFYGTTAAWDPLKFAVPSECAYYLAAAQETFTAGVKEQNQ